MHIKKGDTVVVIAGNDKGVRGEVLRVIPSKNRVVVKGVNMVKKHQRPRQGGRSQVQGGIIEFEAPIDASNVMLIDPESDKPTRVGIRVDDNGQKIRFAKRSGRDID
ncbi:MAG: 50S ribosomal protein L24 [Chloroflexi bacterium]|jgi:large subunit ribosomal protein L24|nr:50S ribosomal protein L24 [Chloroflexota bacterium]